MKWIKSFCIAILLSVIASGLAQAAPTVEKPVALEESMLSITISDLHGLIDGIGSVAAQVSPMMNGMMLKNMLGMQLGDPGLAGIAPSKGLAVVALDPTNIFAVIEVSEAQLSAYTNALAPQGIALKYEKGLLVIGQTEEQLTKGLGLAEAVQNTLLAKRSPSLRITARPAAIVERNTEQIQDLLEMIPMLLGQSMMRSPGATLESTQTALRGVEAEMRVLISLASQCETMEVVLAPENGSVRLSETYVPKAGTRLATLGNAPVLNVPNPKVQAGYLGEGVVSLDATLFNPQALMDFVTAEAEQLSKSMDLSDIDLKKWLTVSAKWWPVFGGSFSEMLDLGGESGIGVGYLMEVKDEVAAYSLLKNLAQDMDPFLNVYEEMGIPLTTEFKEDVREHNGVKIHQLAMKMAMTNQPPEVTEELASMNMNLTNLLYEIAITNGLMVGTLGEGKIETVLDRLTDDSFKPVPLAARSVYPAGGFYYFDLDVDKYMAFVGSLVPDADMPPLVALFQGMEPITSAGFKADGCVMWSLNIPGEFIGRLGQMVMMLQMQQQQGGGMPPQGMPPQGMPQP